jgi:hypothetical protein
MNSTNNYLLEKGIQENLKNNVRINPFFAFDTFSINEIKPDLTGFD